MSVMTAVTDNPHYTDGAFVSPTINKVSDSTTIVSVDMTFASGSADRTGLLRWNKAGHKSVKEDF
ncbi:hypothetical protein [Butyrivibrio sp. AE3003]|uniref:hypothetical protein n=1 Tax=Butyrivibrio sp. AE3003 TaxID=1496721 RepID=UPI00047AEAA2|nr:hypothetical protein [Butyrivibrio sp. AE3003]